MTIREFVDMVHKDPQYYGAQTKKVEPRCPRCGESRKADVADPSSFGIFRIVYDPMMRRIFKTGEVLGCNVCHNCGNIWDYIYKEVPNGSKNY